MQPRAEARKRERVSLEILALFPLDGHRLFHRVALRENIFPTNVNESDANSSTRMLLLTRQTFLLPFPIMLHVLKKYRNATLRA